MRLPIGFVDYTYKESFTCGQVASRWKQCLSTLISERRTLVGANLSELPDYERPPVVETVLSVHFKSLPQLTGFSIGEFWRESLRDTLPKAEERPRYEPPIERFDEPGAQPMGQLMFGQGPFLSRYWFASPDDRHLVQIQSDWFAFNWRKQGGGVYERYPAGLGNFKMYWERFLEFAKQSGASEIHAQQCEVTYINHIPSGQGWRSHGELSSIVRLAGSGSSTGNLPLPEDQNVNARYIMSDEEGRPVGRLHVSVIPAFESNSGKPMFVMNLTARGRPKSPDSEGVLDFFDRGHRQVVTTFSELITDGMQSIWGRKETE